MDEVKAPPDIEGLIATLPWRGVLESQWQWAVQDDCVLHLMNRGTGDYAAIPLVRVPWTMRQLKLRDKKEGVTA